MNLIEEGDLITVSIVAVMAVIINFTVLIGIIQKNTSGVAEGIKLNSYKAAGVFQILNENGEYGKVNIEKLGKRAEKLDNKSGCTIDTPGFREDEKLFLAIANTDCAFYENHSGHVDSYTAIKVPTYTAPSSEGVRDNIEDIIGDITGIELQEEGFNNITVSDRRTAALTDDEENDYPEPMVDQHSNGVSP